MFNEATNLLISINFLISMKSIPVKNAEMMYNIGLMSNYLLLGMIGLNILFVLRNLLLELRLSFIRKRNYYKEKARIKSLINKLGALPDEIEKVETLKTQLNIIEEAEKKPDEDSEVDAALIEEDFDLDD